MERLLYHIFGFAAGILAPMYFHMGILLQPTVNPKNILEVYGFHKLIRGGNKTILIDEYGHKYSTTRDEEDVDDPEKAVMILLLKKEGYNIKDIYTISELIKK